MRAVAQFTEFGKKTKKNLIDINKTQEWLIGQVSERTGLFLDSGYLHKILTGQRQAPKIIAAINEILEIPSSQDSA